MASDPIPSGGEIYLCTTGHARRGLFWCFPPATPAELWTGMALLVLSLLATAWVLKCRSEAMALEQDSITVQGKVLRLWRTPNHAGWYYRVEYEYAAPSEADPRTFRNKAEVGEQHYGQLKVGGPIRVKVCLSDPVNHQVAGEHPRVFSSFGAVLFCLGLLALLALTGIMNLWSWWVSRSNSAAAQILVLNVKRI